MSLRGSLPHVHVRPKTRGSKQILEQSEEPGGFIEQG